MAGIPEHPRASASLSTSAPDLLGQRSKPALTNPENAFARFYNRKSFQFTHGLKGNPLFALDHLVEVAGRLPAHPDFAYWSNGRVAITDPWEKGVAERQSLQDTLRNIATNNSLVILKHTEQDPVLGPVLQELLAKFVEFSGPQMRDDIIVGEAVILVSSPNRITPYHFDADLNFLVQVTGDKTFHIFDHTVAKQVSEEELEAFFSGSVSAGKYSDAKQACATSYALKAGCGLHIPVTAPHWVQNGDNISVALSINYDLKSVAHQAKVYWLNHRLRRRGVTPRAPGFSRWRDGIKASSAGSLKALTRLLRPVTPPPEYPVWTPS